MELTASPSKPGGVLGVVPGIIGSIEAAETIKIITDSGEPLRNRLFTIDVLTLKTEILEF